jgi:hypothetical protein
MKKEKYITSLITISIIGFAMLVALPKTVGAIDLTSAQTQRVQSLKSRADTEISRRVSTLNSLTTKINVLKRLSSAQKANFISDIQNNITSLTSLNIKIDADTDPTILQADVKSIVDNYRIFALYVPKVHLLTGSDTITDVVLNLKSLTTKLQTKITADQKADKNVTDLQVKLTDMQAKTTDAETQEQNIYTTVIQLDPSGYPDNLGSLQSALQMSETAKTDIQTARKDAQLIINELK